MAYHSAIHCDLGDAHLGCRRLMGPQGFLGAQVTLTGVDGKIELPEYHRHETATHPSSRSSLGPQKAILPGNMHL